MVKTKQTGKKVSIYLPERENRLLQQLTATSGLASSKIVATAIKQEYITQHERLRISEGAHLALAAGRFDLLQHMCFDGFNMITTVESAFKEKDGKRGDLADKMDALRHDLDTLVVHAVSVEMPIEFEKDGQFGMKTRYFTDKNLANEYKHNLFMQFSTQLPVTKDTYENENDAIVFMQDGSMVTIVMNEMSL